MKRAIRSTCATSLRDHRPARRWRSGVAGYILSNQRFYLPAWVPGIGTDFYEVEGRARDGAGRRPGPGPDREHRRRQGRRDRQGRRSRTAAPSSTMKIQDKYKPIYKDATILLRPKTGLKDMIARARPGHARGRRDQGGRARPGGQHAARREPGRGPGLARRRHARLPADPARTPAARRSATSADASHAAACAATCARRSSASSRTSRDGASSRSGCSKRRKNISRAIHNFQELVTELGTKDKQLAAFVDSSNANFEAFAAAGGNLREALSLSRGRSQQTPPPSRHRTRWPRARPDARGPAAVRARAGAVPARAAPVPARHLADHPRPDPARSPATCSRRCATCARHGRPRAGHAGPDAQLQGAEQLLQHAGLRPARRRPSPSSSGAPGRRTTARRSRASRTHTAR